MPEYLKLLTFFNHCPDPSIHLWQILELFEKCCVQKAESQCPIPLAPISNEWEVLKLSFEYEFAVTLHPFI